MGADSRPVEVLLVDDHEMFRDGLAHMIEKEPDIRLVGQASSAGEALAILNGVVADVVLLDVDLGRERAIDFVEGAHKAGFSGKILIVTAGVSSQEAIQLVQAGVSGIVHKNRSAVALCGAIRKVFAGEAYMEEDYLPALFRSVNRAKEDRPKFTERDRSVFQFVLQGLTNREIAEKLHISEGAAKASLRQLFEKLGVHTRAQLVRVGLEQYHGHL
jgi:two-component system nitrate/nitrite response regulator NarL